MQYGECSTLGRQCTNINLLHPPQKNMSPKNSSHDQLDTRFLMYVSIRLEHLAIVWAAGSSSLMLLWQMRDLWES